MAIEMQPGSIIDEGTHSVVIDDSPVTVDLSHEQAGPTGAVEEDVSINSGSSTEHEDGPTGAVTIPDPEPVHTDWPRTDSKIVKEARAAAEATVAPEPEPQPAKTKRRSSRSSASKTTAAKLTKAPAKSTRAAKTRSTTRAAKTKGGK